MPTGAPHAPRGQTAQTGLKALRWTSAPTNTHAAALPRGAWLAALVALGMLHGWSIAWPWGVAGQDWLGVDGSVALWPTSGMPLPGLQWASMSVALVLLAPARSAWQAALGGWLFAAAGLGAALWWLHISMHVYGAMPLVLAAAAVAALAGFLALYGAAAFGAFWFFWRLPLYPQALTALFFGACWVLAEWARGTWLTGFPWAAVGYAHVDSLGWLAPWLGVYGMGGVAAALAAAGAVAWRRHPAVWLAVAVGVHLLYALGPRAERWTAEVWSQTAGTLTVRLLQGNVAQDEKFEARTGVAQALQWYGAQLMRGVSPNDEEPTGSDASPLPAGALVVAPETAIPVLPQSVEPSRWHQWLQALAQGQHAVLTGIPLGSAAQGYANSAWGLTPASARSALAQMQAGLLPSQWPQQGGLAGGPGSVGDEGQATPIQPEALAGGEPIYRYDKHHLVPFGEFVPPFFRWFVELMQAPLGDFNRGPLGQPPMRWQGQRLAPNICYEDLFGEELAVAFRQPETAPTVLVNLSNLAWFGNTVALDQHLHISRTRAKELARPMLRATNTGATAFIDHRGRVQAAAPRLVRAAITHTVEGRTGLTPYARWAAHAGQWPLVSLSVLIVLAGLAAARRRLRGRRMGRPSEPPH